MDANPILLVISLIGMLVGALLNLSGKNKDVANGFQSVWAGVEDFMSYIFEGLMRIVAAGIEGFVILINGLIGCITPWRGSGATMWITSAIQPGTLPTKLPPTARPGRLSGRSSRKLPTTPAAPALPPTPRRSSRA